MDKQELIKGLLDLQFICLDQPDSEELEVFSKYENAFGYMKYNIETNEKIGFISLRTMEQFKVYQNSKQYDDFHLAAHFIIIDRIISVLIGYPKGNVKEAIKETLICANNKELVKSLHNYIDTI